MEQGLNTGLLDDLGNIDVELPSVVSKPDDEDPTPLKEIVVQTPNTTNENLVPENISEVVNEVLTKDVYIEEIEDRMHNVLELREIENRILGNRKIDRSDAVTIDIAFEGFLGDKVTKEEFTISPSGVNYNHALKFMSERIALEEEQIVSMYRDGKEPLLELLNKVSSEIIEGLLPKVKEDLYALHQRAELGGYKLNDLILPIKSSIVNTHQLDLASAKTDLNILDECLPEVNLDVERYKKILKSIEDLIMYDTGVRGFIMTFSDISSLAQYLEGTYYNDTVTLEDIINYIKSEGHNEFFDSVTPYLEEQINDVSNALRGIEVDGAGYVEVTDFMITSGKDIIKVIDNVKKVTILLSTLHLLIPAMNEIFDLLENQ